MSTKRTSIWNEQLVEASNFTINPNETVHLLTSAEIGNNSGTIYNSLKVILSYKDLTPDGGSAKIGAVVEAKDVNNKFHPILYQFSPLVQANQGLERTLIMQPDMSDFNAGIDDVIFPVNEAIARISRHQGILPESTFRVCILLVDSNPTGPDAFVSLKVSAEAEQYNV